MALSLSRIKVQIEKLQRQAASIQSTVISRIKREIAQHGLSPSDLFGTQSDGHESGNGRAARKGNAKARKPGAAKPAKFADGQGNTWHGIGKRPSWIHAALEAGRSLEEFLIGKVAPASPAAKAFAKPAKKAAAKKPGRAIEAASTSAPAAKKAKKVASAQPAATKSPAAKKVPKASAPVKSSAKAAAKKAPSKKASAKKPKRTAAIAPAPAVEAPAS